MNRVLLLLALAFVVVLAVPAGAQERDPFQPLISQNAGDTSTTGSGEASAPDAPPMPAPDGEAVPNTGADTGQLAGLGLALIGIGAATILAAAQLRPRRIPHRAGSVA